MSQGKENPHREHWLARARQVSRTVNLGWWLEMLAAPLLIVSLVGAAGMLLMRREFPAVEPWIPAACTGGALLAVALVCRYLAGRKFETPDDS
ncbi:MAG: hypothetical protein EOP85_13110, partial [Verrucomicrobiaceae bacterium]